MCISREVDTFSPSPAPPLLLTVQHWSSKIVNSKKFRNGINHNIKSAVNFAFISNERRRIVNFLFILICGLWLSCGLNFSRVIDCVDTGVLCCVFILSCDSILIISFIFVNAWHIFKLHFWRRAQRKFRGDFSDLIEVDHNPAWAQEEKLEFQSRLIFLMCNFFFIFDIFSTILPSVSFVRFVEGSIGLESRFFFFSFNTQHRRLICEMIS